MSRASGTASSVAVITNSCPGAIPRPTLTATSARRSRFRSNSDVPIKRFLANAVLSAMTHYHAEHSAVTMQDQSGFSPCGRGGWLKQTLQGRITLECRSDGAIPELIQALAY